LFELALAMALGLSLYATAVTSWVSELLKFRPPSPAFRSDASGHSGGLVTSSFHPWRIALLLGNSAA
jgi:hypothetical protein